jgi:hypothetical protein
MPCGIGIMEHWNDGSGGMRFFKIHGEKPRLKLRYSPFFIPNIPFFHHSIIPFNAAR